MRSARTRQILLALYGVGLAVSISGAQLFGYLLVILCALRAFNKESAKNVGRSPLEIPIALYFGWSLIATALTHSAGFFMAVQTQGSFLLFYVAARDFDVEENRTWVRWFCYGSIFSGALAAAQMASGINWIPTVDRYIVPHMFSGLPHKVISVMSLRDGRSLGTRSHPLTFAETLLVGLFLVIAAPLGEKFSIVRRRALGVVAILAGIVLSYGRGVWLGSLAGAALLTFFWRDRRSVRIWAVAMLAAVAVSVALVPGIRGRALSIVAPASGTQGDQGSRSTRFMLWNAAREQFHERPLTGQGIRGMKLLIQEPGATAPRYWTEAHNIFLQVAVEHGLIGFGIFIWMLVLCFRVAFLAPPGWREAGLAALTGLIIAGLTESWVKDGEIVMIFWALMGAIERARLEERA